MPKVTQRYRDERRAAILAGALECFVSKGFQATTIDDIVKHLGISKGGLYGYFSSKEDMYIQMANKRMDEMVASLGAKFKDLPHAADRISYLFGRIKAQPLQELRKWMSFHMEFMLYASRHPELIELHNRYMDKAITLIGELIQDGIQSGEFREELDSTSASYLFWSVRDGLAFHFLLDGQDDRYAAMVDDMEDMVLRYLLKNPEALPKE
ncbi:TetR/AcrR family transcriptional regulator [Paenibacillus nanensis]|uniref:TetR/AcrR family transcriptional regulator n=1 Tax=Paenibacillus nanensis TaxID=393251 RepID=A0A3A1UTM2_9BACL|nr:TetR/AcrR family transcriptional regulator [Paenibacillus nanensis]RIX47074.1 TetR/AcrR family transcriptional regulator [Paenibacillus nanensis]